MTTRDLTKAQFDAALARHGFRREFMGYVNVGHGLSVYARNAGDNRRAQLAYLIREAEKAEHEEREQLSKRFQVKNQTTTTTSK